MADLPPPEPRSRPWALPLAGAAVLVVTGSLGLVENPRASTLGMAALWAVACVAVALGCRAALRRPAAEVAVLTLLVAALLRLAVLPMGTTLSDDFYRYFWDGREVLEGRSPYAATPEELVAAEGLRPGDAELLAGMNSNSFRSVYPPVSQASFALGWALSDGTAAGAVVALRAIFGAVDLLAVGVLLWVLRRLGRHPGWALLYAWHPLAVVEGVGAMHTEALLALPLLAAVGLALPRTVGSKAEKAPRSAAPPRSLAVAGAGLAVAAAAGVKLFPLAAAAVIGARLRGRARVLFVAATAVATVVLLAPLLGPPHGAGVRESLALYAGYFSFNNPIFDGLHQGFQRAGLDSGAASRLASKLLLGVFGLVTLAVIFRAWRGRDLRRLPGLLMVMFGAYLVCSPTVHPWYTLWLLWLVPLTHVARPAILWFAAVAPLTYLAYDPAWGEWGVPWWVLTLEWGGALALLLFADARGAWIGPLMAARARWKAAQLAKHLPSIPGEGAGKAAGRLLDIGCGEGLVTAELGRRSGLEAVGVDVDATGAPPPPPALAVLSYDGHRLPFDDGSFEAVSILTVLHHCDDAGAVLAEAVRVTRPGGRLIVAESVYRTSGGLWLLTRLDRFFNGLRGGGREGLAGPLHFETEAQWAARFAGLGLGTVETRYLSRGLHRHVLFVLDRP